MQQNVNTNFNIIRLINKSNITSCRIIWTNRPKLPPNGRAFRASQQGGGICNSEELCIYLCMIKSLHSEGRGIAAGSWAIIFVFALLHATVALVSRMIDYYDDVPLTVLTITMVIVVAMRQNVRIEIIAVMTLVATLLGFIVGELLWQPIASLVGSTFVAPAITTFLITTMLGWCTLAVSRNGHRFKSYRSTWRLSVVNILSTAMSILLLRVAYVVMFRTQFFTDGTMADAIRLTFGNVLALAVLLCGNTLLAIKSYAHYNAKPREERSRLYGVAFAAATLSIPLLTTAVVYYDIPMMRHSQTDPMQFARLFAVVFLINIIIYTLSYLLQHTIASKRELRSERERRHKAQYQYQRLKQQINPHFLFNSLNILDYLVQEQHTERASSFIRKLAEIYRYMLRTEQQPLVRLEEELDFAGMYIDLLKERFVDGLAVDNRIDPSLLNAYIVPCSLQLLIENATKHNIVSAEEPLRIELSTSGRTLSVVNNLQPRTSIHPSTGLGLANIRQQYADITSREIEITRTDSQFIVKLPLV